MSLDTDDGPCDLPARPPAQSCLAALLRPLHRLWRACGTDRPRLLAARHIDRLSDHVLRDIGLERTEARMAGERPAGRASCPRR